MFLRDMLKHDSDNDEDDQGPKSAAVRRKRKGKSKPYKVLDNRDMLPFTVSLATPDPYTHPSIKKTKARQRSSPVKRTQDSVELGISSSLYMEPRNRRKKKQESASATKIDTSTWLGDFVLDRLTTTGDVLEVGDKQFKVVRHKCQYKYAGGKRFVMTRKILQVKEVGRLRTEEYLRTQLDASKED